MLEDLIFSKLHNTLQITSFRTTLMMMPSFLVCRLTRQTFPSSFHEFSRVSILAKYIQYYGSLMNRACNVPPEWVLQLRNFQWTGQMVQWVQ